MGSLLKKNREECRRFVESLEEGVRVEALPPTLREHAAACNDCRAAAEELAASRALLKELPSQAETPRPWFAPRVMAAIAARESELRRSFDAWTVVPKLAARFTWASAFALLLASTWLYSRPVSAPARPVLTDLTGEPVVENAQMMSADDVLVSLTERKQ